MDTQPEDTDLTENEQRAAAHRAEIDAQTREEQAKSTFPFGKVSEAEPDVKDTPAKPVPMPAASQTPGPVPDGAEPNIQKYDDGKGPRDIGLSDANSDGLIGAGLGNVGRIRRVRDVDIHAIDGVNLADVREKVPFQVRNGESIMVPVEDHPGEWVGGEGRDNKSARRL